MKKRIIIIFIILIVLTAIILPLYFFVFKNNGLSQERAVDLTTRAAIDIGAIEDFEKSPKLEGFNTGSGEGNIIYSKDIPSLNDIALSTVDANAESEVYTASVAEFKSIASFCSRFLKIEKIEQNKIYQSITELKLITFKIVNNEVVFIIKYPEENKFDVISFFYDSVDNEYEYIVSSYSKDANNIFSCTTKRFKANSEALLSYEFYSLSNIENEDILTGMNKGEGQTVLKIIDYKENKETNANFDKTVNADDHFILSHYVYAMYENVFDYLQDTTKAMEETKPAKITFNTAG